MTTPEYLEQSNDTSGDKHFLLDLGHNQRLARLGQSLLSLFHFSPTESCESEKLVLNAKSVSDKIGINDLILVFFGRAVSAFIHVTVFAASRKSEAYR